MGAVFTYYSRPEELSRELHYAARRGIYTWTKDLIKAGADVNVRNQHGQTPLIVATFHENIPIMDLLIDKGADVNDRDVNSERALHCAVRKISRNTVEMLIHKGANVNARNKYAQTPLMLAVFSENIQIVELLIEQGSDINLNDGLNSERALNYAAKQRSGKTLRLLIEKGADVNCGPQTALMTATSYELTNNVLTVMKAGADVNIELHGHGCLTTAFRLLILSGHYRYVKRLIETGADVNVTMSRNIQSCLICMARRGDVGSAKLLLKAGAVVNVRQEDGHSALEFCLERYHRIHGQQQEEEEDRFIILLFAAGEKVPGTRFRFKHSHCETYYVYTPRFLLRMWQPSSLRLAHMCRDRIRKHLMQLSNVNLFAQVTKLGLPVSLELFLVYNVSLD